MQNTLAVTGYSGPFYIRPYFIGPLINTQKIAERLHNIVYHSYNACNRCFEATRSLAYSVPARSASIPILTFFHPRKLATYRSSLPDPAPTLTWLRAL